MYICMHYYTKYLHCGTRIIQAQHGTVQILHFTLCYTILHSIHYAILYYTVYTMLYAQYYLLEGVQEGLVVARLVAEAPQLLLERLRELAVVRCLLLGARHA